MCEYFFISLVDFLFSKHTTKKEEADFLSQPLSFDWNSDRGRYLPIERVEKNEK